MIKTTDFVQVMHQKLLDSGEPSIYWRNALYVGENNGMHIVIYTDGTKQELHGGQKIRKASEVLKNEAVIKLTDRYLKSQKSIRTCAREIIEED